MSGVEAMEALESELTDEEWQALAKVWRISECSQCRRRTLSHKEAPEPKTCGRLTCLIASGEKDWV
jgi:hypothetical protein